MVKYVSKILYNVFTMEEKNMNSTKSMTQIIVELREENQQLKKEKAELLQKIRRLEDEVNTWKTIATK